MSIETGQGFEPKEQKETFLDRLGKNRLVRTLALLGFLTVASVKAAKAEDVQPVNEAQAKIMQLETERVANKLQFTSEAILLWMADDTEHVKVEPQEDGTVKKTITKKEVDPALTLAEIIKPEEEATDFNTEVKEAVIAFNEDVDKLGVTDDQKKLISNLITHDVAEIEDVNGNTPFGEFIDTGEKIIGETKEGAKNIGLTDEQSKGLVTDNIHFVLNLTEAVVGTQRNIPETTENPEANPPTES